MSNAAISVKGLKKSFKDKEVLKGVDFEVQRGEIFALLGSNGAGKTTTVNILSTLMKQDDGEVSICGFDIQRQSDHVRQSISLTGQFAALDGMLTGRENLIMIAKLRGVSNPTQVADNLLARFSLTDAANQRADQYSGGMKRRLDIAMSLIGAPAVIFLDEPTTGLDPEARNRSVGYSQGTCRQRHNDLTYDSVLGGSRTTGRPYRYFAWWNNYYDRYSY